MAVLVEKMEQTLRDRTDLQEEIKSLTAQQRFSAILIFLLPFILAGFLLISNPQYLQPLVEEPLGRILLGSAVFAQFIGLIILSRFMKINY
jgi:tight adherence protein B